MTLSEIDDVAAKQRLHEIAAGNKAALDAHVRRSAELTERARQAFEREEAELKAALQRKAAAEARAAAAEQDKDKPAEETKPRPRPATLALGPEEFRQARHATGEPPKPARPEAKPEPEPPSPGEPPRPSRTLKLGAREDEPGEPARQAAPTPWRRRPARPEGDDDLSGRTWLR